MVLGRKVVETHKTADTSLLEEFGEPSTDQGQLTEEQIKQEETVNFEGVWR